MDEKEIKALAKSNELGIAVVGNRVFEASKYVPGLRVFPTKKWLLLAHYADEMPLNEAAEKVGMTLVQAEEFIDSPMAVSWLERQATIKAARQKWEGGGEWLLKGDECLEGKRHLAKDQQVVFMALGERFAPKPKREEEAKTVINFNFSPESVRAAIERQSAIDAEVA